MWLLQWSLMYVTYPFHTPCPTRLHPIYLFLVHYFPSSSYHLHSFPLPLAEVSLSVAQVITAFWNANQSTYMPHLNLQEKVFSLPAPLYSQNSLRTKLDFTLALAQASSSCLARRGSPNSLFSTPCGPQWCLGTRETENHSISSQPLLFLIGEILPGIPYLLSYYVSGLFH